MSYLQTLINDYRHKGILVDTNLMVLWVVGNFEPQYVGVHKRTQSYEPSDYTIFLNVINNFSRRVTTPNILTEVDNLSRQAGEHMLAGLSNSLAELIDIHLELYTPAKSIIGDSNFHLGLADAITIESGGDFLLFSDDFRLCGLFEQAGGHSININHLRSL